jgi:hypothetical protein
VSRETDAVKFGLPLRPMLYTLDQVADFLSVEVRQLKLTYLYFDGVHVGRPPRSKIVCRNIRPEDGPDNQEWRVAEKELIRWLRFCGWRVYDRAVVGSG